MAGIKYYFPGISLIVMAAIIIVFPEIFIVMIAATITFAGIVALYIGHKMRIGVDEFENARDSAFERLIIDQPIYRRWHKRF